MSDHAFFIVGVCGWNSNIREIQIGQAQDQFQMKCTFHPNTCFSPSSVLLVQVAGFSWTLVVWFATKPKEPQEKVVGQAINLLGFFHENEETR